MILKVVWEVVKRHLALALLTVKDQGFVLEGKEVRSLVEANSHRQPSRPDFGTKDFRKLKG